MDTGILSISGASFGLNPEVLIGNDGMLEPLFIITVSDTFIEAELLTTDPGTYLLVVDNGTGNFMSAMDVTIGAVGHSLDAADGDPVDALFVNNDGNVSIGAELDVVGSIRSDGTLVCLADGTDCPPGTPNPNIITEGTPAFNTAIEVDALVSNTTGRNNTASGYLALLENTTGFNNTASGLQALLNNNIGNHNTATGVSALALNTIGNRNTATGASALFRNDSGDDNTATGLGALKAKTTGDFNIALGFGAGLNLTTGDKNIYIGNDGVAVESNRIRIGNVTDHTHAFIAGVPIVAPSSKRFKENIHDMGEATTNLMRLRPVTFRYKKEYDAGDGQLQYGLIAEEVAEVYPELVVYDDQGRVKTVLHQQLSGMLLNELQKQHWQVQELTERLTRMEQVLTAQQSFAALKE